MLPLHRWFVCTVGVLMSTGALAQAAPAPPTIDESKIPEWVKRQARSAYKVIIESSAAKARTPVAGLGSAAASVPKEDSAARLAKKATPAAATAPVATPTTAKAEAPATVAAAPTATPEAGTPGSVLRDTAAAPPGAANPEDMSPATSIPAQPVTLQLATATAPSTPARPATAAATLPAPPPEPSPLTLLNRVEPEFASDLVNDRLNQANVVVSFTVRPDGEVVNVSVASSSDPRLNRSVLRAVRAWRYAPIDAPREHSVRFAFTTS